MTAHMGQIDANEEPAGPSDVELITAARAGDDAAFGRLYERHVGAARRLARTLSRRADADDLVSDAFTRVYLVLKRGGGPDLAFRPYVYTTVRRLAYDRSARQRREVATEPDALDAASDTVAPFVDPAVAELDRSLTARAYLELPERWQAVLWYSEVEQLSPGEVGELLGLSANATSALAYRAREGLRQAYLQLHVQSEPPRWCQPTIDKLGAFVRGGISERERTAVESHLDECERCRALYLELVDVEHGMRAFVAPLFLGAGAAGLFAKAGLVGWIVRLRPRSTAHAGTMAGGSVAAAVVAAVAVAALTGGDPSRPRTAPVTSPPAAAVTVPHPSASTDPPAVTSPSTASTTVAPTTSAATTNASTPAPTTQPPAVTTDPPVVGATTVPPTVAPAGRPDLSVQVTSSGGLVAGQAGTVSVRVANRGDGVAPDVELALDAPGVDVELSSSRTRLARAHPGRAHPSAAAGLCNAGSMLRCSLGDLPAGTDTQLHFRATPSFASSATFTVAVRSNARDRDTTNDRVVFDVAVADDGFSARFLDSGPLRVTTIANGSLSCRSGTRACERARRLEGGRVTNNYWNMTPVDVDANPATRNSSRATLEVDGSVVFAGLYWGADLDAGGGGTPASHPARANEVLFTADGVDRRVAADEVARKFSRYQGFADVTAIVRSAGSGSYTVADIQTSTGSGSYAGWSLVVVTRSAGAPERTVAVFDGLLQVSPGITARATIGGFTAPAGAQALVGLVGYEGDATQTGDSVRLNGNSLGDASNPTNDVMNSSISVRGAAGGRDPADRNTFGIDADLIDASGRIAAGARRAELEFATGGEVYLVGVALLSIER